MRERNWEITQKSARSWTWTSRPVSATSDLIGHAIEYQQAEVPGYGSFSLTIRMIPRLTDAQQQLIGHANDSDRLSQRLVALAHIVRIAEEQWDTLEWTDAGDAFLTVSEKT